MNAGGPRNLLVVLGIVVVGLGFLGAALFFVYKKRRDFGDLKVTDASGYMMAMAMAQVLKGQETTEALGRVLFDSLRLGNFQAFRGTFVTIREAEALFSGETLNLVKWIVNHPESLREAFASLRDQLNAAAQEYNGFETPVTSEGAEGYQPEASSLLLGSDKGLQRLAVGTIVKGSFGWKMVLPPTTALKGFGGSEGTV